ncbi:MAG: glycoside hydrolase family 97 protein [Pseudomonadota bacterium]
MTVRRAFHVCLAILGFAAFAAAARAETVTVSSPNDEIVVTLTDEGGFARYSATFRGEEAVGASRLGLLFEDHFGFDRGLEISGVERASRDETWEQHWGEDRLIRDHHNEAAVTFTATEGPRRRVIVRVRVFDDGFGFRYETPKQAAFRKDVAIIDELTEFAFDAASTAWWIPSREWNRYEYLYRETPATEVYLAHTPMTLKTPAGAYLSVHEAALVDYSGMSLKQAREGRFKADLAPWSDGALVKTKVPFKTPWRTVQISPDPTGLMNSRMILNLNEPNALGDVSWVEPGKYVGIWWAMHIRDRSWGTDMIHGATTEETKRYMDFAAEHGFDGVLVEGWNIGWDGDWYNNGDLFRFAEPYPDFDIAEIARHGEQIGVRLIGHHETSGDVTNYEAQLDDAFDLYEKSGVRQVKTGYVADGGLIERLDERGIKKYEWHDGQFTNDHHLRVIRKAAEHKMSINPHEPVKDTGLRRTYPNWISREGARGQEYNAWALPPNPPEHTAIIPFTRMLSGPMDFTPGVFDLRPNEREPLRPDMPRSDTRSRVETTLAKQLSLYVVLYSPIQMAADLPENYEARPDAFQFIKDVPTDWEKSVALDGEIGDYVVVARKERGGNDWYLGALTDEEAREITVPLDFLEPGAAYTAEIYRDGEGAHYNTAPYEIVIEETSVTAADEIVLPLGPGGGAAIRFVVAE